MTDEYTPTDEQVRMGFVAALQWAAEAEGGEVDEAEALAAFDRWLVERDRQVAEQAWHVVVAALMEAVRIPQLVGWLGRLTNRALVARQNMQERIGR